jgi:hypothetical protein
MLLCDASGSYWHKHLITPPPKHVPAGTWLCPPCVMTGVDIQEVKLHILAAPALAEDPLVKKVKGEQTRYHGLNAAVAVESGAPSRLATIKYVGHMGRTAMFNFQFDIGPSTRDEVYLAELTRLLSNAHAELPTFIGPGRPRLPTSSPYRHCRPHYHRAPAPAPASPRPPPLPRPPCLANPPALPYPLPRPCHPPLPFTSPRQLPCPPLARGCALPNPGLTTATPTPPPWPLPCQPHSPELP